MKKSFFLQLSFVLILCAGFTCQKKYPPPLAESTSDSSTETATEGDSSSENSNSTSETTETSKVKTEKPVDKTDK